MRNGISFAGTGRLVAAAAALFLAGTASAEDELYDLDLDPGEVRNLATDPAYGDQLARLRRRLVAWMEEIDDPLLNGWTRKQLLDGLCL